ncbi:MAG: fibronectin type III domain-containing protein, partial [Bacteroidales bacterium]|nr:fibronectin type III domain-containing protein [Bacteroidales bacterium]
TTQENADITITFNSFTTESYNYNYDYMTLYDGTSTAGTQIAKLGGVGSTISANITTPTSYTATSGALTVVWVSDGSQTRDGWDATVSSTCRVCNTPTNLHATNVTENSAQMAWTAYEGNTEWELGFSGSNNVITVTTNPFTITGLENNTSYNIKIRAKCGNNFYSEWSDFCEIHTLGCNTPTNLHATNVTANSAQMAWTADEGQTEWELGFSGSSNVITATTNPFTITGLEPDTYYNIKIRAKCGDNFYSDWSDFLEIYTGYCTPAPSSRDNSGITNIEFETNSNTINTSTHPTSSPYYGNYTSIVIDAEASTEVIARITYETYYSYGTVIWVDWNKDLQFSDDEIVYIGESETADLYILEASFVVPESISAGSYRMRIGGADMAFDNDYYNPCYNSTYAIFEDYTINVLPAPSCPRPRDLSFSNITANSVELSWAPTGSETEWEIMLNDDPSNIISVNSNPYTLTGLTAATDYSVKLRAVCSSDDKSTWRTASFSTLEVLNLLPFFCDFEDSEVNSQWSFLDEYENKWIINSNASGFEGNSMYISNDNSSHNYNTSSESVAFASVCSYFEDKDYIISFDWSVEGESNYDFLQVFLIPKNCISDPFASSNRTASSEWIEITPKLSYQSDISHFETEISMQSGSYRLTFYWRNDNSYGTEPPAAIDNVSITPITCTPPRDLSADYIGTTTAQISWTDNNEGCGMWEIAINNDTVISTETQYTFTGLAELTTYNVSVRALCGDENASKWRSISFNTFPDAVSTPYECGFETDAENERWIFENLQYGTNINQWYIGEATSYNSQKSLYISNTDGLTNEYNLVSRSVACAYIYINILDQLSELSFDWKCLGDGHTDFLKVFLAPYTANTNEYSGNEYTPNNWILLSNYISGKTYWQKHTRKINVTPGYYKLIFVWVNDQEGGAQPPAAIDNISVKPLDCDNISQPFIEKFSYGDSQLCWTVINVDNDGSYFYW